MDSIMNGRHYVDLKVVDARSQEWILRYYTRHNGVPCRAPHFLNVPYPARHGTLRLAGLKGLGWYDFTALQLGSLNLFEKNVFKLAMS
ncbi:hypothetical protein EZV62_013647 [Acer yangbiense]|uniref:Uncharacterized protein n=1 Tax=Acer yangbiense TaxID=1000413 RepID=A0A5C7HZY8_9ROSI|nr:hypothetical protein EZV62_013647 [Acer yangbiense]